jgi:hypothetical protein
MCTECKYFSVAGPTLVVSRFRFYKYLTSYALDINPGFHTLVLRDLTRTGILQQRQNLAAFNPQANYTD